MRQKSSLKKAPDSPQSPSVFKDELHRQTFWFVQLARKFFVSSLLKRQLSILIDLAPNDTSYSSSLKAKFVANFNKKASKLPQQRIPFMLLYFMSNTGCSSPNVGLFTLESFYKLSDDKLDNEAIQGPVFEKVLRDEKNEKLEKKKTDFENKQLMDFFYLLLDGCIKIFEV